MSGGRFEIGHRQHFLEWGPYISPRVEKSREGSTNGPISGSLRVFQTKLAKNEACWKTVKRAGKSAEQPGVDCVPALICVLAAVPSALATTSPTARPETYSRQRK